MKVMIAVAGAETEDYFQRVAALVPLDRAGEIVLAHVIDTRQRAEMEFGRERHFTKRPLPENRSNDLTRAETDRAQASLQFARHALLATGIPGERLREVMLRGKPNEELIALANREEIELIVVGGRGGKPGPHSLGKTARFVVDHAPHAALLIR